MTDRLDEEFQALAAEYALGLLAPAEARAFENAMAADPDLRDAYALWAEDFAALTEEVEPVAAPEALKASIETAIFGAGKARGRLLRSNSPFLSRFPLLPSALIGAVLAAIVFVSVDLRLAAPTFAPDLTAAVAAGDQSLIVAAAFDRDTGLLRLDRQAGAAAEGRALEIWIIAGNAAPVSLGLLAEAQATEIAVPEALRAAFEGGILAISDEPPGGSPTGAPTGAVLATGPLTSV